TERQEDRETEGRKDRSALRLSVPPSLCLSVSLSLCLSVSLSLFVCLLAVPVGRAVRQDPPEQESKAKKPPISSHVILITINGLRSDFVAGAESERLNLPTIQSLRSRGSFAVGIESVFPSQTIPAHASMITGSPPADHGLSSDYPFDEENASQSKEPRKSARQIRIETVFEAARRAKLVTAAVGFPLTTDAAINFNRPDTVEDYFKADAAAEIIEKYRPNLLLVNFTSFDDAQRRYGLLSPESLKAMGTIDSLVKKIIGATESSRIAEETTFILVSDSGASRVEKEFNPNVLLAKKKWLVSDGQGRITSWRAVAQSFGGSAAVFVKDPKDEGFIREVETFFIEQAGKTDSPIWRVITMREAIKLGADPRAALYLDAAPHYAMTAKTTGSPVTRAPQSADRTARGYAPSRVEMRALFVIAGKGIKSGAQTPYARLIDIAPTVARLLGLEMKTARGRVITEVIK
ncbi:MAG: alkaline phosphatase family protein, partial [Blastocatellia bacterium]